MRACSWEADWVWLVGGGSHKAAVRVAQGLSHARYAVCLPALPLLPPSGMALPPHTPITHRARSCADARHRLSATQTIAHHHHNPTPAPPSHPS